MPEENTVVKFLGTVLVDSGKLAIIDPLYINEAKNNTENVLRQTAAVIDCHLGNGEYTVWSEKSVRDGHIVRVIVDLEHAADPEAPEPSES